MTGHAKRPPSGAAAWVNCGAWVAMNAAFPSVDTEASAEGVAAHEILEPVYREGVGKFASAAAVASNGVFIDDDMVRGAVEFAQFVRSIAAPHASLVFEQTLPPGRFGPDTWGTPDLFFWNGPDELHVVDYKYGHGFVDAFANWQLITYLALLLDWYQVDGLHEQRLKVGLHIVQPRNFERNSSVRSWYVVAAELRAYFNQLEMAAGRLTDVATTGEHCRYCPGRVGCAANRRAAGFALDVTLAAEPLNLPMPLAGDELRRVQRALSLLEARAKGLEDEIKRACDQGDYSHGFELDRTRGRAHWVVPVEKVIELGRAFGVDLSKPVEAVTPRQATLAGIPVEVVNSLSNRNAGKVELVPAEQSSARKVFGHNKSE